jgi:hypothetical protein
VGLPNDDLAELVERAGLSWAGLARRVNDVGARDGLALRYDYTSVHRWVRKGEKPKRYVPDLLARVLSERLGYRIAPSDFGMTDESSLASRALRYHAAESDTVDTIIELGRADVKRRSILSAPFVLAALAEPSRDWLLAWLESVAGERGPGQVGLDQGRRGPA